MGEPKPEQVTVTLNRDAAAHLLERCTETTNAPKVNGYSCETCREIGETLRAALERSEDG